MAELPDTNGNGPDDDWRRGYKWRYSGREFSFDELRADVEAEAAGLDTEQWIDGEFDFDWWLSASVLARTVRRVDNDDQ